MTKIDKDGYILIWKPEHPKSVYGYVRQHRLVMESFLERYLTPDEIIHHKNDNRKDNHILNLELMTKAQHNAHHKHHKLDMSNRKCLICGVNKTNRWHRHPITNEEWTCDICYNKIVWSRSKRQRILSSLYNL